MAVTVWIVCSWAASQRLGVDRWSWLRDDSKVDHLGGFVLFTVALVR